MSGICGILRLDGGPADPGLLEAMVDRMAWRGPEGRGRWIEGPAALGFVKRSDTPEAAREEQPLRDAARGVVLAFDGRVDNREDLIAALGQRGVEAAGATDADLVLRAHALWGDGFLDRVVGDFALALWDARRRRLLLARDPMGLRPLYHHRGRGFLLFGSDVRCVLADPAAPVRPNPGAVAEFLAGLPASPEETLYEGVLRLPPHHLLVAEEAEPAVRPWWRPPTGPRIPSRSPGEARERFAELLDRAVRARLRTTGRVGVALSSGIDSGAVLAAAAAAGEAPLALTWTFPGRAEDEGPGAEATARHAGAPWTAVPRAAAVAEAGPASLVEEARAFGWPPAGPAGTGEHALHRAARAAGVRVLLTGHGGDEWQGRERSEIREALLSGEWGTAFGMIRLHAGGAPRRALSHLLHGLAGPLLPRGYRVRRALRAAGVDGGGPAHARLSRLHPALLGDPATRAETALAARAGWWQDDYELDERMGSASGMDTRHPLLDRRILEFLFRLPPSLAWGGGAGKGLLRSDARGRLPRELRERIEKPHWTAIREEEVGRLLAAGGETLPPGAVRVLEAAGITVSGTPPWEVIALAPWLATMGRHEREPQQFGSLRRAR